VTLPGDGRLGRRICRGMQTTGGTFVPRSSDRDANGVRDAVWHLLDLQPTAGFGVEVVFDGQVVRGAYKSAFPRGEAVSL
jgi:hypothetical protein